MSETDGEAMQRILSYLRVRSGHDFANYKKSTVSRRIARRMQVQRAETLADYLVVLRENPGEAPALFADLLISVTTFFRDPTAFEKLAALVIPRLFEEKGVAGPDSCLGCRLRHRRGGLLDRHSAARGGGPSGDSM